MKLTANVFIKSLLCTLLSLAIFFLASANAQQLNKEQIKVAYIYNFLKHINWPEEEKKTRFVISVYQDKKFHTLLKKSFQNRKVKNKDISILLIFNLTQASASDLFVIPKQFNNQLAQIARTIRGSQTLLVTDNSPDTHNAMINLIDSNGSDAVSFEVNKSNIIFERLTTSAQLLLLGGTELDIATLYRQTEQAMQATRERESSLNAKLAIQQAKLSQTSIKLNKLNNDLQRSSEEIKHQQSAMKELINSEHKKAQELAEILQQLNEANTNYSIQTQAVSEKKQEVAVKEKEKLQMASLIEQNKLILQQQQQNIATQQQELIIQKQALAKQNTELSSQQQELDVQHGELAAQQQTIVSQKATITITTMLAFIIAFALILVVGLFIKNKKTTQKLSETLNHLKETQAQLVQSEKMASLGKLIAGVAHEINTPLGIAVTSTSLIQENTEDMAKKLADKSLSQKQLQSYINIVIESSAISNKGLERVIELMHNFKEVAADQIIERIREINIADYVNEVMSTLANEMKKNQVNYIFNGDNAIRINTVPGALAQVITNLVNNSIRHGFQLNDEIRKEENNIEINLEQTSIDEICLTYQDNGIGMSKEVLAQVFEPFFTTKRNKGGTGLGMNIVFNVIEQKLSGHIEINSAPNEGVICKITLPLLLTTD